VIEVISHRVFGQMASSLPEEPHRGPLNLLSARAANHEIVLQRHRGSCGGSEAERGAARTAACGSTSSADERGVLERNGAGGITLCDISREVSDWRKGRGRARGGNQKKGR